MEVLKILLEQKFWVIALVLGVVLVAFPCLTIDKDYHLAPHAPTTLIPVVVGIVLVGLAIAAFGYTLFYHRRSTNTFSGLDMRRVKESDGVLWTSVAGCEIRVASGRIEEYAQSEDITVVLPCYEYFDEGCIGDIRSSLGAYAKCVFKERSLEFASLVESEARRRLGPGTEQRKTYETRAESFGVGKCLLMINPLSVKVRVALVSTTTQRAGEGLVARVSYLIEGMHELFTSLADKRINEVAMPILGSGHGQLDPQLAFVGLLLAVAEAARYDRGGQRPKKVTIVVFKKDASSPAQVDDVVVRRALALVGSDS